MSQPGQLSHGIPPREPIAELSRRIRELEQKVQQMHGNIVQVVNGKHSGLIGVGVTQTGANSNAGGDSTQATGDNSLAEGDGSVAGGEASHAEGDGTVASGDGSHAEGGSTTASADNSHAEGEVTIASGTDSHAEGYGAHAFRSAEHATASRLGKTLQHSEASVTANNGTSDLNVGNTADPIVIPVHDGNFDAKLTIFSDDLADRWDITFRGSNSATNFAGRSAGTVTIAASAGGGATVYGPSTITWAVTGDSAGNVLITPSASISDRYAHVELFELHANT